MVLAALTSQIQLLMHQIVGLLAILSGISTSK